MRTATVTRPLCDTAPFPTVSNKPLTWRCLASLSRKLSLHQPSSDRPRRARSVVMKHRNPHCLADSGNRGDTVRARPDARERERCVLLKQQERDQLLKFQSGEGPSASSSSRSPPSPNREKDEASITGRKLVRQNHHHHQIFYRRTAPVYACRRSSTRRTWACRTKPSWGCTLLCHCPG